MANNQQINVTLKLAGDVADVQSKVGAVQKELSKLKLPSTLQNSFNQTFSKLDTEFTKFQSQLKNGFKSKGDVTGLETTAKAINLAFDKLSTDMAKIKGLDINSVFNLSPDAANRIKQIGQEIANFEAQLKSIKGVTPEIQQALGKLSTKKSIDVGNIAKQKAEMGDYAGAIAAVNQQIDSYNKFLLTGAGKAHAATINEQITNLENLKVELTNASQGQQEFNNKIKGLDSEKATILATAMENAKKTIESTSSSINTLGNNFRSKLNPEIQETVSSMFSFEKEMGQLKNRVGHFFGLTNGVQLFRRAVTSALNTVKELDATMTEAAVVTDFSVGDMWDKLPEYASQASNLGAKINDLYGATTLYYQQGLETNAAMALGVETMKMARIAGMDSAAATEAMTAALRGFNMELNETSATRVNDVYSELAAITAADTEQIATAMSKTASIASAANMEFESTAAFLSQIIETTQEAPETAGTALKTIIARFSEVKSLREKGLSSGEDSEGELIDVNKIQGALRTVGISMDEFFAGTEGLDSVLMKLAAKWGTLDFETQRYIATTAAGSRQQSRFIAMMSNYDRTMELVSAANNSAGASQEQFNKTLESMDAKLNQLKDAWDQFLMGLANNEVLKAGIDVLAFILETINKLLSTLSGGSGIVKTFLTAFMAIKGFNLGRKAFGGILGGISGLFGGEGKVKGESISLGQRIGTYIGQGIKTVKTRGVGNILLEKMGFTQSEISKQIKGSNLSRNLNLSQLDFSKANIDFGTELGQNIKNNLNKQISAANISPDVKINLRTDLLNGDLQSLQKNAQAAGVPLKILGEDAAKAGAQIYKMQASTQTLTMAASAAGTGLMMLLGPLEKIGASEKVIGVIKAIATALMVLPMVFKIVEGAVHVFAKSATGAISSIPIIGWIAAAISAIIALVGVLTTLIETEEERLKRLQENAEKTHQAAEQVKSDYENINSTLESLGKKEADLDKLTKGTDEWKKSVQGLNQEILELIKLDPEILKYGFIKNEGGVLKIDTETDGYKQYLDDQMQEVADSNTAVAAADLAVSEQDLKVAREDFAFMRGDTSWIKKVNDNFRETGDYSSTAAFKRKLSNANASGVNRLNKKEFAEAEENYTEIDRVIEEALINQSIDFSKGEDAVKEYVRSMAESGQLNIDLTKNSQGQDYIDKYFYSDFNFGKIADHYKDMELKGIDNQAILMGEKLANLEATNIGEKNYDLVSAYQDQIYLDTFRKISDDDIELNDELKQSYAAAQGYKFKNDKFYSVDKETGAETEVSINEDTLTQYGKIKETNNQVQEKLSQFSEGIEKIQLDNPKTAKNIENLLLKQGAGVTENLAQELGQLFTTDSEGNKVVKNQGDFNAKYQSWGGDEIFGSIENFTNLLQNSLDNYDQNINNINQSWSSILSQEALNDPNNIMGQAIAGGTLDLSKIISGVEGIDLTAGQFKGLADSLMKVYSAGGDVKAFGEQLSTILGQIQEKDVPEVLNLLSTTDFSNKDSIEQTIQGIENLGYEIDDNLIKTLVETSKAIRKVNIEKLNEKLKTLDGVIKSITDKIENDEKIYSKEDVDTLRDQGIDTSQFIRIGVDEYSFIGDTNELLSSLNENVASILAQITGDLREQVNVGQKIDNIMTNDKKSWTVGEERYTKRDILNQIRYGKLNPSQFEEGKGEVALRQTATDLGMDPEVVAYSSIEYLMTEISNHLATYWGTNGEVYNQNKNILESEEEGAKSLEYTTTNETGQITAVQQWQQDSREIEDQQNSGEITQSQATDNRINNFSALQDGLDGLIASEDGLSIAVERATEDLRKQNKTVDTNLLKQLAINSRTAAKNQDKLNETLSDNIDAFKKGKKGGQAYDAALEKITESAQNVFGSHITSDFVEENAELFKQLEKGGKQGQAAYEKIAAAAGEKFVEGLGLAETELYRVNELVAGLDGLNLEIGSTADFSDTFNELAALMGDAQTAADYLESLGYEVEWKEVGTKKIQVGYDADVINGSIINPEPHYETVPVYEAVVQKKDSSGFTGSKSGGGGGGSDKPKTQHWENPYDKLYNVTEEIEELQRDRNTLEEEFSALMEDGWLNAEKVNEAINKQAENLSRELALQRKVTAERKKQLASIQQEKYTYTKKNGKKEEEVTTTYKNAWSALGLDKTLGMSFEQLFKYDEERGVKILDVEALNKIVENQDLGEDQGALVESIIGKAEEWIQSLEEAEDAARELERQLKELEDIGKEDAIEMENRLAEALQELRQREIDDMQSLSETLSEANSSILDSLQESIDLERQIRDNTKQEEDIADMEARLAYLRRDTSGANQQEILQLEEQLGDARESYSDSLVDQQLQKLSDSNAKAEEQRQQQIELAQAQLDYQVESGEILREAENMLKTMSPEKIKEILKEAENYESLSKIQQMDWMNDTNNLLEGWKIGMKNWELEEVKDKEGTISAKDEEGNALKLRYDKEKGKWVDDATGNSYSAATWDEEKGTYVAYGKTEPEGASDGGTPTDPGSQTPTENYPYGKPSEATKTVKKGQKGQPVKAVQYALNKLGYGNSGTSSIDGNFGSNTEKAVKAFQGAMGISKDGKVGPKTRAKFKAKQFKTGGIADFTGPAWLDGTKSKPEIILNQQDSKNFIMLKDILGEILQGATSGKSAEKSGGDNYFDISIIVDEISSDYDVDKMAARIKQQIYDDSTYRNVNAINLIR